MMEYRILESKGFFTIQVKEIITKTSGFLWWKKSEQVEQWVCADELGYPYHFYSYPRLNIFRPMKSFGTLEAANARIKVLLSPPVIHYPS